MKNVLVTGGAGFIGSHLVDELIKNKDYNIIVVDDLSTGKIQNIDKYFGKERFLFWAGKIQNQKSAQKFDIIYHLGAKANTREEGLGDFEDNVMATETVVKMLKPDGHIYFSSSCAVYGNQTFVDEQSPFKPISPYGYSKWMNELTIKDNCKNYTIFRFSNVFGERQEGSNEMGLIGVITHCLKNDTNVYVFNQGENYRDYIYVKDVVKALTTIHKKDIFQVGQCKRYKTMDLIKLSGVKWFYGGVNNEAESIKLSNAKLKHLGWSATLEVTEYIKGLKK